jgi:outer membrane protein assembly factor BamA
MNDYLAHSLIIPGKSFHLDELAREKQLLWEHLQNQGYFHLRKNQILMVADTTVGEGQVDLEYSIQSDEPDRVCQKVYVHDVRVEMDDDLKLKKHLMESTLAVKPDSLYSYEDSQKTIRNLNGLGMFNEPLITYQLLPGDSSQVNALVKLKTTDMFSLGMQSDANLKNTGYIGPDLGFSATQKNLFGGAEHLTLSVSGYMDFPYGIMNHRVSRSYGYRVGANLSAPVRRLDFLIRHAVVTPRKFLSLDYEKNRRIDYFTITEWKAATGLKWHSSSRVSHQINLVNMNYASLVDTTAEFSAMLEENEAARNSYRDQFILGPSYTFTYNNTLNKTSRFMTYYRFGVETSGNLLNGLYSLAGKTGKDKEFLRVKFNQYVRMRSDFRVYYRLGKGSSQLVFRNVLGYGSAYGNSNYLPYTRLFYIGGSNSLRPLTARVVGPGRYLEFNEAAYNQVGDIKIENNLEYRFKIWYILYGALWGDLGNIWLSREDPERPGSGIQFNSILRDSYFNAGGGLRIDLDFLVVRADYGLILYAPFFTKGTGWVWQNKLPLHGLVLGIGYPF